MSAVTTGGWGVGVGEGVDATDGPASSGGVNGSGPTLALVRSWIPDAPPLWFPLSRKTPTPIPIANTTSRAMDRRARRERPRPSDGALGRRVGGLGSGGRRGAGAPGGGTEGRGGRKGGGGNGGRGGKGGGGGPPGG